MLGRAHHFQRPANAGTVRRSQLNSTFRVFKGQRGVRLIERERADLCAYFRIYRRNRGDPIEQRPHVKTGTANKDRH